MSEPMQARAFISGIATLACKAVNERLRDRRFGFHYWEPRTNHPTLRCELAAGGAFAADIASISVVDGTVQYRLNDDAPVKLGAVPAVDRVKVESLLLHFAAEAIARHAQAARRRPPVVGLIQRGSADIGGAARGAAGRGGGRAT